MIKNDEIGLVINVPTHESKRLEDNFQMRRSAMDFGVPLLTNMNLVKMFSHSLSKNAEKGGFTGLKPQTLFEHYAAESDEDAWTSPTEFH